MARAMASTPAHLLPPLLRHLAGGHGGGSGRVGHRVEHDVADAPPRRRRRRDHHPRLQQLGALARRRRCPRRSCRRPEEEAVGVAARRRRRRGGRRRGAERRGPGHLVAGRHEAHSPDDAGEGLAVVALARLLLLQDAPPRAHAADAVPTGAGAGAGADAGDDVARQRRPGQEQRPDVLPRRPPLHHLELLGPRRLRLGCARLAAGSRGGSVGVGVPTLCRRRGIRLRVPLRPSQRRRLLLVLEEPLHELQPWRQVERQQVALVEQLVRRGRERRLPVPGVGTGSPGALELEAWRGWRRHRWGQVHVDVVVLDHHCGGWPRHCRNANASFGAPSFGTGRL
ncbi:hypothetical protein SORBI_3009G020800 [Sorghum bicolor]|uniref:Uncharacterized protein n=1 Tax=Sorghum bicolor TaxID=4558 RepID=A0A1Z5R0G0_SORBI|nr:hypothetical protein SORBI_3009G020800 [Sorghum bicolor]